VQETVTFRGIVIGESQRVECEVQATKTTLDGDPPLFSGYSIVESDVTDRLPDGNYELLVNRERTRFSRRRRTFPITPILIGSRHQPGTLIDIVRNPHRRDFEAFMASRAKHPDRVSSFFPIASEPWAADT